MTDAGARHADELVAALEPALPGRVELDAPLAGLTTYRVGGPADVLVRARREGDLAVVAAALRRHHPPLLILGRGSNLLIADRGFPGLALLLEGEFEEITPGEGTGAGRGAVGLPGRGAPLRRRRPHRPRVLRRHPRHRRRRGADERRRPRSRDPGGAPRRGWWTCSATGSASIDPVDELALGYRTSSIGPNDVVAGATFNVEADTPEACEARIAEIVRWRREHQPGGANAGSVFRNPPGESAGSLIERCGLKGLRIGGAVVSPKHANFIQAEPGATAADVRALVAMCSAGSGTRPASSSSPSCTLVGFDRLGGSVVSDDPTRPTARGRPAPDPGRARTGARPDPAVHRGPDPRPGPWRHRRRPGAVRLTAPKPPRSATRRHRCDPADPQAGSRPQGALARRPAQPPGRPGSTSTGAFDGARRSPHRPGVDPDVEIDLVAAERQEAAGSTQAAASTGAGRRRGPAVPGSIDPRIRERRVAVTRAEGRRRLRILLTAVCIASAIGIAWLVVQSPMLAVDSINVRGTTQESQAAVRDAAGVHTGSALLFVDTGAVARRVEALPWVASAKVDRGLPNDLTITVVERAPIAWSRRPVPRGSPQGTLGAVALVDRFGRVLGDAAGAAARLPRELIGMTCVPERGGRIGPAAPAAVAQLPGCAAGPDRVRGARKGPGRPEACRNRPGCDPGRGEVRLGNLEDVEHKGAALAVLDVLAAGGEHVQYIDVRVPGAPATR